MEAWIFLRRSHSEHSCMMQSNPSKSLSITAFASSPRMMESPSVWAFVMKSIISSVNFVLGSVSYPGSAFLSVESVVGKRLCLGLGGYYLEFYRLR